MTKQEIFDTVARGIITQGGPSFKFNGNTFCCKFRGENGRKCAIGHLIPDSEYFYEMENLVLSEIYNIIKIDDCGNGDYDLEFLAELQSIHDNNLNQEYSVPSDEEYMIEWKKRMTQFAYCNNLSVEILI